MAFASISTFPMTFGASLWIWLAIEKGFEGLKNEGKERDGVSKLYVECNLCSLFFSEWVSVSIYDFFTICVLFFSYFFLITRSPVFVSFSLSLSSLSISHALYLFTISYPIPQIGSLIIESTRKKDSGNYSCSPSNSPPITVSLHVINGKFAESGTTPG